MIPIPYFSVIVGITILWILARICVWLRCRKVSWKREAELILVYICIIVVVRFTFFPFSKVNGRVQPLNLDMARIFPMVSIPALQLPAPPLVRTVSMPSFPASR